MAVFAKTDIFTVFGDFHDFEQNAVLLKIVTFIKNKHF
jgi:hypothetical protein